MPTVLEFNNKRFNYQKLLAVKSTGISAFFKPDEMCIKSTAENLVFTGGQPDDKQTLPIIYLYRGTYIVLAGMDAVRKAVASSSEIHAMLFTKYTLAKSEILPDPEPEQESGERQYNGLYNTARRADYSRSRYDSRSDSPRNTSGGYRGDRW